MARIVNIVCILVACAALVFTCFNFVNNPVKAKRADLEDELRNIDGMQIVGMGADFTWPFADWQGAIRGHPKLWDALTEPPKVRRALPTVAKAPEWATLLKGVRALTRARGGKPKIIDPGGDPAGDYLGVGTMVINGCTIESFDRSTVTFSHYWAPTKKTRTHTIPRMRK